MFHLNLTLSVNLSLDKYQTFKFFHIVQICDNLSEDAYNSPKDFKNTQNLIAFIVLHTGYKFYMFYKRPPAY